MTDIDKLALSIVQAQYPEMKPSYKGRRLTIARLGILEGMKLQRERDAVIAESLYEQSALVGDCDTEIKRNAAHQAAQAIRSAL